MPRPLLETGAVALFDRLIGRPFGEVDPRLDASVNLRNRGWVGQWLERQLGLANGNAPLDFEDGELKTFESARGWLPVHGQVALATIDDPDELLALPSFETSAVAKKLAHTLFAGYRKPGKDPHDWYFAFALGFQLSSAPGLAARLEASYETILRAFSADARADDDAPSRDHTYREDLLILKNKDSRRDGAYDAGWSRESDRVLTARKLGFYLTPQFFDALAAAPHELAWHGGRER